ncbi:helix-turn-helix domain-containing protein [Chitinophaga silvisoli]|nr:AraC family transcriptional regulator [Chitinophaga silvisoli]
MDQQPYNVDSISELHKLFFLPPPKNPLITVIDLKGNLSQDHIEAKRLLINFYSIWFKEDVSGVVRYGQRAFDFQTGTLTFQGPGQVISMHKHYFSAGWGVAFHSDLLLSHTTLRDTIKAYNFFSYDVYQGLHLSEEEDKKIRALVADIAIECESNDPLSRTVLIAQLELLLARLYRVYKQQMNPARRDPTDLLRQVENILDQQAHAKQLLTVQLLAAQLRLSPHYLSDKLKELTGMNARQHIQARMIEKAKHLLGTTTYSVSEVAFQLGFEHMQSFCKVFKNKTGQSPSEFRENL